MVTFMSTAPFYLGLILLFIMSLMDDRLYRNWSDGLKVKAMKVLTALAIICAIITSGCSTIPKNFENDEVLITDGELFVFTGDGMSQQEIERITIKYTLPFYDDEEKKAYKRLLWGQGLDAATTGVALSMGCKEANPLFGGSFVAVLGAKIALAKIYKAQAKKTPEGFSLSKTGNAAGLIGGAAGVWNLTHILSVGCG